MITILRFTLFFLLAPVCAIVAQAVGAFHDDFHTVDTHSAAESIILESVDGEIFSYDSSGALLQQRRSIEGEDDLSRYEELETSGAIQPLFAFLAKFVAANNAIPSTLARVVPDNAATRASGTLGRSNADDVFVTAAEDIRGLNSAQIAERLTIQPSSTGFRITEFATPPNGLATPINRLDDGFIGGGRATGGAREFVIPNGPIPPGATTRTIP